jgi:hypothetical protein
LVSCRGHGELRAVGEGDGREFAAGLEEGAEIFDLGHTAAS